MSIGDQEECCSGAIDDVRFYDRAVSAAEMRRCGGSVFSPRGRHRQTDATRPGRRLSFATTVRSPLEALEHDEILRTRWFCFIGLGIGCSARPPRPCCPAIRSRRGCSSSRSACRSFGLAFLYNRTRDPIEFRRPSTSLAGSSRPRARRRRSRSSARTRRCRSCWCSASTSPGSAAACALSITIWAVCSGMELFVGMLVVLGAHDTGLIRADSLSTFDRMVVLGLVQAVLFATLITARMSRRTTLLALGELERAVRDRGASRGAVARGARRARARAAPGPRPVQRSGDRRLHARRRCSAAARWARSTRRRARGRRSRSSCCRSRRSATRPRAAIPARAANRGRRALAARRARDRGRRATRAVPRDGATRRPIARRDPARAARVRRPRRRSSSRVTSAWASRPRPPRASSIAISSRRTCSATATRGRCSISASRARPTTATR